MLFVKMFKTMNKNISHMDILTSLAKMIFSMSIIRKLFLMRRSGNSSNAATQFFSHLYHIHIRQKCS